MKDDVMLDINFDMAIDIITSNIAELTKEYSTTKDNNKIKELKNKIEVLNKIKDEIYQGNNNIVNKVIEKKEKGML